MTANDVRIPPLPLGQPLLAGVTALAAGVAVDVLAFRHPAGFGLMAACLIVLGVIAVSPRWARRPSPSPWILAIGAFSAVSIGVRSSPTLTGVNLAVFAMMSTIAVHQLSGSRIHSWYVSDYVLNALSTYTTVASAAVAFATTDLRPLQRRYDGSRMKPLVFGVMLGLPLLLVFGGLFASADAAFAEILKDLFRIDFNLAALISRVVTISIVTAAALGVWRFGLTQRRKDGSLVRAGFTLDSRSAAIALGLLVALFAAFVTVQITYLFGGLTALKGTGLTYSEYARRGFFELVVVAALVLGVVLLFDWATHRGREERARVVDLLAMTLIGLTFAILASAGYRMSLYTSALGLTELRLYTSVFMGWIGVVLVWTLLTVLRGQRGRFAFGAFVAGAVVVVGLTLANPDAIIANANLHNRSVELDAAYLSLLSADALPTVVSYVGAADIDCSTRTELLISAEIVDDGDWRSTTVGDLRARASLDSLPPC